jgi:uncharacterized iron-regulated membrane protein
MIVIGAFVFSIIVLFAVILGVVWFLARFVKYDTWKYDENFIWNQPAHAAHEPHAAPGAVKHHAGHTHGA